MTALPRTARRFALTLACFAVLACVPGCVVFDPVRQWPNGATLAVCFVDPAPVQIRQRIAAAAAEWEKWANLHFDFGPAEMPRLCDRGTPYDITIGFTQSGSGSLIGTASRAAKPSMNLGHFDDEDGTAARNPREFDRIVMHEFGHAIGLEHEFQSPNGNCNDRIDWQKARAYFAEHMGWSGEQVDENLRVIDRHLRAPDMRMKVSPYDRASIMQYALPPDVFTDGNEDPCYSPPNYQLSDTDKQWIATIYPKPLR